MEGLEHRRYDGVEFIGELGKRDGTGVKRALMPIVLTSQFFDILDDDDSLQRAGKIGEIKRSLSQTSQVFIDNMIGKLDDGLRLNWDYVEALFEPEVIAAMFNQYTQLLEAIIRD